jgi:hypothetical protein
VKVVRKCVPMIVLLLVLTLLLGPAAAAGRPPKGEAKVVVFSGDIEGQADLIVESQRNGVTVYGPLEGDIELTFVDPLWGDFAGPHEGKLRITLKRGVATVYFGFDSLYYAELDAWVPSHQLEGFGTYNVDEATYQITLDETTIYDVVPHTTGKSGGYGLKYTNPTPIGDVGFVMTIGE